MADIATPRRVSAPDDAATVSAVTAAAARPLKGSGLGRALRKAGWWQPIAVFAVLVALWYWVASYYDSQQLAFLVPYPHLVLKAMFADPLFTPLLVADLGNSTMVALTGLVVAIIIGVLWAIVMSQAKWAERSLYPYAVILQCIPILALVPLIGALFGYEFLSRVIVTVMIAIFPMVSNTLFGLQSVDRSQRELFILQGASRWTTLSKLQFPAALPSIFVGLRTAAGLSVIGAIVGDQFFQRGTPGLGVLIQVSTSRLNGPGTFAAIITASLLGVAVFILFGLLGKLAVGKWYDFG
ncbi:ABC transporter permease [Psychromicrobium xiongbiense]|uniref:ABC transporter permease n=1 Tax=Psychromicrobium xiongbiense TaxID=3051184 RepID=UPI002554146C|nr:ABC transporter permease [Psychromicrobium sp. YIM S02556]